VGNQPGTAGLIRFREEYRFFIDKHTDLALTFLHRGQHTSRLSRQEIRARTFFGGEKTVASRNLSASCLSTNVQCMFLLAVFSLGSSAVSNAQCGSVPPSTTGTVTWTAQWCDEFNGTLNSPISSANWTYDTGNSGFGNNELETYCDPTVTPAVAPCSNATPNAYIDGSGHLAIHVLSPSANTWTSARLKTAGLQSFHAGRIEANIQIPSHAGLWPAFWMLGSQSGVSWPTVGESDILENWPTTSTIGGPGATGNCSTVHTQVTAGSGKGKCFTLPSSGRVDDPGGHIYGQIWSANMIQYYIDDPTQPFFVVTASDPQRQLHNHGQCLHRQQFGHGSTRRNHDIQPDGELGIGGHEHGVGTAVSGCPLSAAEQLFFLTHLQACHCRIRGFATEYSKSVRKFTAT
jgi:beta-glucanase (GH16 family)